MTEAMHSTYTPTSMTPPPHCPPPFGFQAAVSSFEVGFIVINSLHLIHIPSAFAVQSLYFRDCIIAV